MRSDDVGMIIDDSPSPVLVMNDTDNSGLLFRQILPSGLFSIALFCAVFESSTSGQLLSAAFCLLIVGLGMTNTSTRKWEAGPVLCALLFTIISFHFRIMGD